jgi:hypothetical protein
MFCTDVVREVLCVYLLGAIAKFIEMNIGFAKSIRLQKTNRLRLVGKNYFGFLKFFRTSM